MTHRVPARASVRSLTAVVTALRGSGCSVVVACCPDLGTVEPVPNPLRALGRRLSRTLAAAQALATEAAGGFPVELGALLGPEFAAEPVAYFSEDRFHPSSVGKAGDGPAMAALTRLLIRDGRPSEAVTVARDLATRNPADPEARALLGAALLEAGNPSEAIPALEKSLELGPRPAVHRTLARALAAAGRPDDALAAIGSASRDAEDALLRGEILRGASRIPEALAAYDAAIATGSHLDVAYLERARALADAGRYLEALADLDAALGLDPGEAEVWREHGGIALTAKRPRTALRSLERATGLDPGDAGAWGLRAEALEALGRTEEAARCRERARGPGDPVNPG